MPQVKPRSTMKKDWYKDTCQTSIDTHPGCAPKGRPQIRDRDHHHPLYSQSSEDKKGRRLCRRVEGNQSISLWDVEDMHSSTRVSSAAPVRNARSNKDYRNDSPARRDSSACCFLSKGQGVAQLGVHILKYCRHEEKKKKRKFERAWWAVENIYPVPGGEPGKSASAISGALVPKRPHA